MSAVGLSGRSYDAAYTRRILLVLGGLVTIVLYIEGMLTPSLPSIGSEFHVSIGEASLVLSSYLITGVALSPVVGKLGDIYGKKKMLAIVVVLYAVCVSVTGFSPNFGFMVAARAFQGIGLTVFPLGMSLVREEFPREMVPKAQGLLSAMFGVGFAISLPLGSWVSNSYGWRTTYHTSIPFVIALAVLVILWVRESEFRRPETRVDYLGALLLGGSLAAFVLALSEGPTWGWLASPTLGLVVIGAILLVPLTAYERWYHARGGESILDLRLLKERNVLVTNIVGGISGLGMYLALLSLTYLFETPAPVGYGLSILGAGLGLLPLALAMLIFSPIAGSLVSRIGTRPMTALGSVVTAVAFLFAIPVQSLNQLYIAEFFMGAGIAIMNASVINLLVLTVAPRDMGLATSMNSVFRNVGSSVGAPLSGSLLATFVYAVIPGVGAIPSTVAFQWSFAIAAVTFLAAAVTVYFAREVLGRPLRRAATSEAAPSGRPEPESIG